MKAAPCAVLGAAVLAGWISSPAVAFSPKVASDQTAAQASCAPGFLEQVAQVRLSPDATATSHAHGASCTCAACAAKTASSTD